VKCYERLPLHITLAGQAVDVDQLFLTSVSRPLVSKGEVFDSTKEIANLGKRVFVCGMRLKEEQL